MAREGEFCNDTGVLWVGVAGSILRYDVFGKFVEYGYTHIVGSTMLEICGGRSRRRGYPSLCVGRGRH